MSLMSLILLEEWSSGTVVRDRNLLSRFFEETDLCGGRWKSMGGGPVEETDVRCCGFSRCRRSGSHD
ncbi:unnamed protein product [Calypogeia fissa]